ncbi:MAG: DUF2520 domain-containing protein [Microscillaceae bacterium]|nr:DUF2520 domain-containing protein [Microscillaceae bacterium]MDW8459900.1 DUF2520 domain-containing protein [Cytophagales bacterium]
MKIILIGAGNLAWHLTCNFIQKGIEIVAIYSQTLTKAQELAQEFGLEQVLVTNHLKKLAQLQADVCLLALKDDVLPNICQQLQLQPNILVAHTSGSQPLNILQHFKNYGVFYPLQTFTKGKAIDFSIIPLCLEANTPNNELILRKLAQKLTSSIYTVNSEQRVVLHIAAVMACNFTNHLWACADRILQREHLDFHILQPLIAETLQKAFALSPKQAQTGPAKRNDVQTISKHEQFLAQNHTDLLPLYQILTKSISSYYYPS